MSTVSRMTPLPRPYNWWSHVHSPRESPLPRPLNLGSYVHSLWCPHLPDPFIWHHMSTGSSVTPSKYLHLGNMSRVSLETPFQDCVSGVTFSVSRVNSLPTPAHGVTGPCLQGDKPPEPCTWGHTSRVSSVTAPHQNLYLESHVHSL